MTFTVMMIMILLSINISMIEDILIQFRISNARNALMFHCIINMLTDDNNESLVIRLDINSRSHKSAGVLQALSLYRAITSRMSTASFNATRHKPLPMELFLIMEIMIHKGISSNVCILVE